MKSSPTIAVVRLSYVRLPLAVKFGKRFQPVGFDISERNLARLRKGVKAIEKAPGKQAVKNFLRPRPGALSERDTDTEDLAAALGFEPKTH